MSKSTDIFPWDARSIEQGRFWQSNDGGIRLVENMEERHVENLIRYIQVNDVEFRRNEMARLRSQADTYSHDDPLHHFIEARRERVRNMHPRRYVNGSPLMVALNRRYLAIQKEKDQIAININNDIRDIDPDAIAHRLAFELGSSRHVDPLAKAVPLREVLEWVKDWVPAPARPLWEKAFIEQFTGGDDV